MKVAGGGILMKAFFSSDFGRGIKGVLISIGLTLAVIFPVIMMEFITKVFKLF